jgi:hypothetical protein
VACPAYGSLIVRRFASAGINAETAEQEQGAQAMGDHSVNLLHTEPLSLTRFPL